MRRTLALLLGLTGAAVLAPALTIPARADENADLDMIPTEMSKSEAPAAPGAPPRGKLALESAAALATLRGPLPVPPPGRTPPRWSGRTSLDLRWQGDLAPTLAFSFSDRLDLYARDGLAFGQGRTAANNLREAYVTWEPAARTYIEAGRINLRSGVALGFNPTDFFRTGSAVEQSTADPSAMRENRLGTVMLRSQHIATWGGLSLAYAPKLSDPTRIGQGATAPLDPHIDRTNATDRVLATLHADIGTIAPDLLVFRDNNRTRLGATVTAPIGQQIVAYAEWAGGAEQQLAAAAVADGIRTGTLPPGTPILPAASTARPFASDLAVGFSWTGEAKLTLNAEYIFHQAGFTRADWQRWYGLGHASSRLAGLMWYERAFAADRQTPAARQQIFLRATWPDAIARDIDLTALTFVSLDDGSGLAQLTATWNIDRQWSAAAILASTFGPPRSAYGSLKPAGSATGQVIRYF
jgi:hypothetical protein